MIKEFFVIINKSQNEKGNFILAIIGTIVSCKKADAAATEICDGCLTFNFEIHNRLMILN